MLLYIDYLDHVTNGSHNSKDVEQRLRFDLLIYAGNDKLCISVPACVKLGSTTELLMKLDPFWGSHKILLQLDKKHKGKADNYFSKRKKVLEKSMKEDDLLHHFEYVAYQDPRTHTFFDEYMPQIVKGNESDQFIDKVNDTDALFRKEAADIFQKHNDAICRTMDFPHAVKFWGATSRICDFAMDRSILFQRSLVENNIIREFHPRENEKYIIASLLDRAFSLANAGSSEALPLSLILNQLTGPWLADLLRRSYKQLFSLICNMTWHEVYSLSQNEDWCRFIKYINAYIYFIQDSFIRKQDFRMQRYIDRLVHSISLLSLLKGASDKAISAIKSKFYNMGMFTQAQDLSLMKDFAIQSYNGKHKLLYNVVCCIDVTAQTLTQSLATARKYSSFPVIGDLQKNIGTDLLR